MKKSIWAVVAMAAMAVLFPVAVFAADEVKPLNLKDPRGLEGGRWEALGYVNYGGRSGQDKAEVIISIDRITDDGKAVGTYKIKRTQESEYHTVEINSRIQTTPEGLPRLDVRGIDSSRISWVDMQQDGSFKHWIGAILKRVK
jgi:hypothetical protein